MPFDPEDEEGWNALPTVSDDEEAPSGSIGPLHSATSSFQYAIQDTGQVLSISSQPEKGLSFQIWPSALSLSKYAELQHSQHRGHWKGKRVIELGAGCGLVGLVFAALGATVLLTDLPNVLPLLDSNIALNQAAVEAGGGSVHCGNLTWGVTAVASLGQDWAGPDLVVAADVVYHRELFNPLLCTMSSLGGQAIVLAHVRRWKSDAVFFKQLKKRFEVVDITAEIHLDAAQLSSHTRGALRLFLLHHK
ncbi:hypothetical protein ABBQ38_000869 [Trebouxia sp. C0009 RCD-2024]